MLGLGSEELIDERPDNEPLEFERLNHFVGFERNAVKPLDGEVERGKASVPPGERVP